MHPCVCLLIPHTSVTQLIVPLHEWGMAADDLTEFQLFQQKTRNCGCNGLRNEITGHWRIGKTLPGLMNPSSCCVKLMGGLGYGGNHEYMHSSCYVSTLQLVVWWCGVGFMADIGPLDKSGATFECHRISEQHCQSGASLHGSSVSIGELMISAG
jgi:hypothetical protein